MSSALYLTILFLGVVALAAPTFDSSFDAQWYKWKMKHGRTYNPREEEQWRAIWEKNMKMTQLYSGENLGKHGFTTKISTSGEVESNTEELKVLKNGFQNQKHRNGVLQESQQKEIPRQTCGWEREKLQISSGGPGSVQCLLDFFFGTSGSLEGQMSQETGKLVSLSERSLADCSLPQHNQGCKAGLRHRAFQGELGARTQRAPTHSKSG
ncbi:Cathepsin L1 [Microtus ochrogaster]|uniref:Cathepsin L1 n=1 Tax=Microtus ochrogaster TaxID=79684 RepID=A0A8J6G5X4_MICOH|nr:Cathepsin L1 [Microtus ochrogaster]